MLSRLLRLGFPVLVAGGFGAILSPPASADPYSLPIASKGPVALPPVADAGTHAAQQLAAQVGLSRFTAPDWRPGLVRHIVMFRYRPGTSAVRKQEITGRFLRLVEDSRRPDGTHPVRSIETGVQNSGEGVDDGLEQAFLVTFNSEGDRNFYVGKPVVTDPAFFDPAHEAFKQFAGPSIEKTVVFDYDVLAAFSWDAGKKTGRQRSRR